MSLETEWVARKSENIPSQFVRSYGTLLGQSLWGRGFVDSEQIQMFLNPRLSSIQSPFRILNLESAVERVIRAFEAGEKIGIYGDYDIDGMSSIALLVDFFKDCAFSNVVHYQPDRLNEGYGLHKYVIERWKKEDQVDLIITVDNGITAEQEVSFARSLDIDVIITDHHSALEGKLPETPWILNPNQPADDSGLGYLCGAGVAYYLCMGLKIKLKEKGYFQKKSIPEMDLKKYLDLFALATVADQVDLKHENRSLLKAALPILLRSQRPGLKELLFRTLRNFDDVSSRDIAFSVAPKLNAASRMGQGNVSLELLLATDKLQAVELVERILETNTERSRVQSEIFDSAVCQVAENGYAEDPLLVLAGPWHEGVLGIVAAKVSEKFSKPTLVLGNYENTFRGSMRSFGKLNCVQILEGAQDYLIKWGGHPAAAGLQLLQENLEKFRRAANEKALEILASQSEREEILYDGLLPRHQELSLKDVKALKQMAPFGMGNPDPLFRLNKLSLEKMTVLKDQHVRFDLGASVQVIGFFKAEVCRQLQRENIHYIDVLVCPEVNRFREKDRLQLRIEYVRANEC